MSLRDATIDRERRDLVSHQVMDESRLIRFVAGPDGQVVPDLGRKLPGRGLWVEASRASIEASVKKNGFTRPDRKSTRLNSSHVVILYAVLCLKKKQKKKHNTLCLHCLHL